MKIRIVIPPTTKIKVVIPLQEIRQRITTLSYLNNSLTLNNNFIGVK